MRESSQLTKGFEVGFGCLLCGYSARNCNLDKPNTENTRAGDSVLPLGRMKTISISTALSVSCLLPSRVPSAGVLSSLQRSSRRRSAAGCEAASLLGRTALSPNQPSLPTFAGLTQHLELYGESLRRPSLSAFRAIATIYCAFTSNSTAGCGQPANL